MNPDNEQMGPILALMALGDPDRLAIPEDDGELGFVDEQVVSDIAEWIESH